ncbi:MAG: hypothetical protein RL392_1071 [Pseudomonadota bacterium]
MTDLNYIRGFLIAVLCCMALPCTAQQVTDAPIVPGERASDWLLRNVPLMGDTSAVHWLVAAEVRAQEQLRQSVLQALFDRDGLTQFLSEMAPTGRLRLAKADSRWLQGAPNQDPVLQADQGMRRYERSQFVAVLTETGEVCRAMHTSGALASDYLLGCGAAGLTDSVDFVWLAQPDGRTQRVGVALWNQTAQDQPAPGAWIWAPTRSSGIHASVSDNLIRFLATQPPLEYLHIGKKAPIQAAKTVIPTQAIPRDAAISSSDWGEIGLLQTPTARMAPAGEFRFTWSKVQPYTRGTMMFQPFDWLEGGFRYTDISNRLYGAEIAGDQSLKDKSIDLKIRLVEESAFRPQVAVGARDLGGTGLFAGEYVVANKRWGSWDASLGVGWGTLGTRADFAGTGVRQGITEAGGGTANLKDMFKGPAALFGGVQWQAPSSAWLVKAEWDGNDYQHEAHNNIQTVNSALNWGAVYRYSPNVDFNMGWERGNRLMLGLTIQADLKKYNVPKVFDPVPPPVLAVVPAEISPDGWKDAAHAVELFTGWSVQQIAQNRGEVSVVIETDNAPYVQERIDKAISVLHRQAPANVTAFNLQLKDRGLVVSNVNVNRFEWMAQHTGPVPTALRLPTQQLTPGSRAMKETAKTNSIASAESGFEAASVRETSLELAPNYQQILGGPDGFILYQLGVLAKLEHRFSESSWLAADFNARAVDNYGGFKYDAPSGLPRVRTLQREFTISNRTTMPLAQLTSVSDLGRGHYGSVYGGMLESMYGGVGAEWLYRPWQGSFAFGVDVNHVQQRGFKQDFEFRDYSVNTGHASLYWDTGWNHLQVNLSAGQYLAGDVGATLDVKRVFPNGVAIGAWATKTNVSAEQFGEGSFDKGIYINIPFDALAPKSTSGLANIVWNPLTRDGGAKLERRFKLYDLTRYRDARTWKWRSYAEEVPVTGQDTSFVLTGPQDTLLDRPWATGKSLMQQVAGIPGTTWLWAGGAVLAAGAIDSHLDQWFQNQQSSELNRVGAAINNVPYVLAAGAGAMALGIAGEAASQTAATSLAAAAYTLGANYITRYAVGRARPLDEQGASSFNGFKSEAVRSGFASNHVAVAFALATPFAQQYNMPWLYTAAASTALGRLNDREHWLSDTVAGGLMGYAIGSLLSEQQQGRRRAMRLSATPQSIDATWSF